MMKSVCIYRYINNKSTRSSFSTYLLISTAGRSSPTTSARLATLFLRQWSFGWSLESLTRWKSRRLCFILQSRRLLAHEKICVLLFQKCYTNELLYGLNFTCWRGCLAGIAHVILSAQWAWFPVSEILLSFNKNSFQTPICRLSLSREFFVLWELSSDRSPLVRLPAAGGH